MRLALVQAGLGAGGAERVVSLIAADRCARGDEVHVLAFVAPGEKSYFPLPPEVVVHRLGDATRERRRPGIWGSLGRVRKLRAELQALQPDLVVSFLTKINTLSLLATTGLDVPTVISERNNPQVQQKHILWRLVEPLVRGQATRMVLQTTAILQTIPQPLRDRAEVICNPCDAGEQRAGPPPSAGVRRIVAVGRLVEQKGFDLLVDAFSEVASAFPDWSLTIHGEGPERERLQERIDKREMQGAIRLAGVTRRPGEWIEGASVFVLSSRYEGFPNVLIEAMAAGIPVIATRCDFGPGDIVGDGVSGLLVAVDDVDALAAALRRMMADAELRASLPPSGRLAVARFSTEAIMSQWDTCFRRALRDHRSRTRAFPTPAGEKE